MSDTETHIRLFADRIAFEQALAQLAAKDREIAALMKERDMWKGSSCAMEGLVRENDDRIAALRQREALLEASAHMAPEGR